jgi:predicted deacylase
MKRDLVDDDSRPGVRRGTLAFEAPVLAGWRLPLVEIEGRTPGPRLCVQAGVHVNEVSSIEAAIRLSGAFDPAALRGSVSIIPVVNQPALPEYTQYDCPIDGKNINFSFPGDPRGTFTEALCHALLFDWAGDADLHVDLHGGDLREAVSHFVMFQRTGAADDDARRQRLARCFDADIAVGFGPEHLARPGRALSALARVGRDGVMSEAGANGRIDEACVAFHLNGVLNLARALGMIGGTPSPAARANVLCHDYLWIACPRDGFFHAEVEPAEAVAEGQRLGVLHDVYGSELAELRAPQAGLVLWVMTHPWLKAGDSALAVAVPAGV